MDKEILSPAWFVFDHSSDSPIILRLQTLNQSPADKTQARQNQIIPEKILCCHYIMLVVDLCQFEIIKRLNPPERWSAAITSLQINLSFENNRSRETFVDCLLIVLVGDPQGLIGSQFQGCEQIIKNLAAEQVMPFRGFDQVDTGQGNLLLLVSDVIDAEYTLLPFPALAPERKDALAQVQRILGRVGMKRRLPGPDRNQFFQTLQHDTVMRTG